MERHLLKHTIIIAAVGIISVPAFAEQIPYSMRACGVAEAKVLDSVGGTAIGSESSVGTAVSVPAGNAKSFDNTTYKCNSTWNASKAGVGYAFRCVFVDQDGDKLVGVSIGNEQGWEWKFLAGEGKWKGITGGGSGRIVQQFPKPDPATTANCWEATGSYELVN